MKIEYLLKCKEEIFSAIRSYFMTTKSIPIAINEKITSAKEHGLAVLS